MHHHATAGLLHRLDDGVQVQGPQAAQVDDLGVDAGFLGRHLRHIDGGAVGEDGHVLARAGDGRHVQGDLVVAVRHLGRRVFRPGGYRAIVVAVEGAVIQALGFEEDHRVIVLDGGDQQALGVVGVGRHHGAQAADLGKHRLDALATGSPAVDAAAARHAQGRWAR